MRKLEPGDLQGFYLGKLINCCQSMNGTGKEVARHGMSEIDSGFYVIQEMTEGVRNPQGDRIVAEFWAWLGDDRKSIVFDSFERLGMEHDKLCRLFINAVARELEGKYEYIGLGSSPTAGSLSFNMEEQKTPTQMRKAAGYGLENKKVLCLDGEKQNDVTKQILVVDIVELNQLGFLDTDENLDSVLMHNKDLGLRNEEVIDSLGSEQLYYVGLALLGELEGLFNKLLQKWKIDLKSYLELYQISGSLSLKSLQLFIDAGADVNMKDKNGNMPMVSAAKSKETLGMLIENGIDFSARDAQGYTLLFAAVYVDDIETSKMLIAAKADVNIFCKDEHKTPLYEAARRGSSDMVEILIAAGADINAKDEWGNTPLSIAKSRVNPDIKTIRILLDSVAAAGLQESALDQLDDASALAESAHVAPHLDVGLPSGSDIHGNECAALIGLTFVETYEAFYLPSHL